MKNIRACKLLFFINLICMLWLPNFCDIKQKDATNPNLQGHQNMPSDSSRIDNVPTKQKETTKLNVETLKESNVQPSVEYVYSHSQEKNLEEVVETGSLPPRTESFDSSTKEEALESLESSSQIISIIEENVISDTVLSQTEDATIDSKNDTEISPASTTEQTEPSSHISERTPVSEQVSSTVQVDASDIIVASSTVPDSFVSSNLVQESMLQSVENPNIRKFEDIVHQQPHYDGMPSFDEWKKMMLAEQEKGGQKVPSPSPPGKKISSQKRRRNYSSYECGAKIVAANSEAEGTSRILNELVDEYMLNPCKVKIWFVIELCETVQASQIELANFELFSSCPKDFVVYSSDNFPTRDWVQLGSFTAAEQRVLQSFELKQEGFGKFIKIELQSYYGKEHYCPLSVVRVFGTSMVDEYEEMETLHSHHEISEDDSDRLDIPLEDTKSTNLFGSATDAVMNIVKKAAQALGQQTTEESKNDTVAEQNVSESKLCNLIDSSQEKCEDVLQKPERSSLSSLPEFLIPSTSIRQSMFQLLHRCDQCVSSRIGYYSSAQPHCRFFQAALGPVAFQALCDWFKEHPLLIARESQAPLKKAVPVDSFVKSPTKSPPPQIMQILPETDSPLKILLNNSLSPINKSERTVTINATNTTYNKDNKSNLISDEITLQSSLPLQTTLNKSINDNKREITQSTENLLQEHVYEYPSKATITIPLKTVDIDKISDEVSTTSVIMNDISAINELTDSEEQQINEFLSDPSTASPEDIALEETVSVTEIPSSIKSTEEKFSDMRSEIQGKVEPAILPAGVTVGQKESVFMRMSNRIKALEINMSLSSQYLQELSQRYRRQMEEMQRAFNRTVGTLNDTARKAAEKDFKQQEILNTLQLQVANLSETVEFLLNQRSSAFREMVETHVCLMVIEAIIMVTIMSLCVRRLSSTRQVPSLEEKTISPSRISKRRNSADSCTPPIARKVKKRSASDEALNAEEVLIVEPTTVLDPLLKAKKKNRRRNKGLQRSVSHPFVPHRNFISTSQCAVKIIDSHSDGCQLPNVKSRHLNLRTNHFCENCNTNGCILVKSTEKGRRLNVAPLQNLTNGSVISSALPKEKEKFSFRKFLKFQKRDSI